MKKSFYKQFLAIMSYEEELSKVTGSNEIEKYIYKSIVSIPNRELLTEIKNILQKANISGIITRGSVAHYLYSHNVSVPIFDLRFDLPTLFKILEQCSKSNYKKICVFEIAHIKSESHSENLFTHNYFDEYELYYYRMPDYKEVEKTIAILAKNKNIDVLIGDLEPTRIAMRYGIPTYPIKISVDSWKKAVSQARHSSDIVVKEKSKNNFIRIITNIMSEAVIIVDATGNTENYNLQAEKLFFSDSNLHNIQEIFNIEMKELLKAPANYIAKHSQNNYVINIIPVILDNEELFAIIINNIKYVENLEMSIRTQNQQKGLSAKMTFKDIVCADIKTKKLVDIAKRYAKSNSTILIYGESGTGKEVFASSIHNESLCSEGPFVAINCAALNENLIESELFGYEKGSFTGALTKGKKGLFEIAHNGTLFLDEISELPLGSQAKLLRVIQEKEIMRIGDNKVIPIDVRIICATNQNLKRLVQEKLFREDLYYRLALLEIDIPPLHHRPNDIIPLFITFLMQILEKENKSIYWDSSYIFEPLLYYSWPGNVRELNNFAERVIILADKNKIDENFIKEMVSQKYKAEDIPSYTGPITNSLKELETNYIKFLLEKFSGDKEEICRFLNISKTTLWRKLNSF